VDFFEATNFFVNIFLILGRTAKIPDRGLISEKHEGLSAKLAKSRPRVDFPKVQRPFCKISEISGITNYFLTDNSWTGSTSPWTGRARSVHRGPMPARTTGTMARSPEHGLQPLRCAKARRRGCKTEREARELGSGLTGARAVVWRLGGGGGVKRSREIGGEGFQRGRGEEKGLVRCGCSGVHRGGFYRARGGRRGGGRSNGGDE
jgi:hypothetical protein